MSPLVLLPSFFLFFSSQLCEGRQLFMALDDVVDHDSKMTRTYDLSYKNEDSTVVRVEDRAQVQLMKLTREGRTMEHGKQTVEGGKRTAEGTGEKSVISGLVVRIKLLSTVPWNVPRKRHAEPGFHLDYAPPKIHPPSHN
ncbi:unnamed protein product [Victoria cruziana]